MFSWLFHLPIFDQMRPSGRDPAPHVGFRARQAKSPYPIYSGSPAISGDETHGFPSPPRGGFGFIENGALMNRMHCLILHGVFM